MLWNTLLLALREIRRNVMRSSLTILGVVTLGGGASAQITTEIASLGKNLLIVTPGAAERSLGVTSSAAPFNLNDAIAFDQEISNVTAVAASATKSMRVVYGSKNRSTTVNGTDNAFFKVKNWPINQGRLFSEAAMRCSGRKILLVPQSGLGHWLVKWSGCLNPRVGG